MKHNQHLVFMLFELTAVFLITAAMFAWGRRIAQMERSYEAMGGEYLPLALPVFYYVGKQIIHSWGIDIWKKYGESRNDERNDTNPNTRHCREDAPQ